MTHRTKSVIKILAVVVLLAAMFAVFAGCTPRDPDNVILNPGNSSNYSKIGRKEAQSYTQAAIANRKEYYKIEEGATAEWFVIDLTFDFSFTDRTNGYEEITKFTLILKANWNTVDNNKSELYLRMIDAESLTTVLGVYYYDATMFVTLMDGIAGYESMSYRFNEINFSTVAGLIAPLLNSMGLDPAVLITSIMAGTMETELGGFLKALGVDITSFMGVIEMALSSYVFTSDKNQDSSTYEMSADGNTETIGYRINLNGLLNLLKNAGPLMGLLGRIIPALQGVTQISWEAFGLPDFDPIMEQFFGFSLAKLRDNDWPQMTDSFLKSVAVKKTIGDREAFVLDGLEISIACDPTETYPEGQYDSVIRISPFFLGSRTEKQEISFSGLELDSSSTKYREGGLLNLETQLALEFTAPENTTLTVGDIVGDTLDDLLPDNNLDSLKKLPISFNGYNYEDPETGEKMTRYRFDLEVKLDLDLFDGTKNNAEINLYAQDEKILSVYLVGTTIYIYTENLKGASFSIPNISIPNVDLTALLFGDGGLLSAAMPYLDPYYGAENGGGSVVDPDEPENGGIDTPSAAEVDVLALLKQLITYKSYYNWKGEKIENEEGNITLPGSENAPLIFELDGDSLNALLENFLDFSDLGIESVRLETMLSHPQDSTKISIVLPKGVKAEILLTKIAWLGKPSFDFSNVENAEYAEVGGDANFFAVLGGEFELGIAKTDDAARVVMNLSDLIANLTQDIFLDLGLSVSDTASTKIRYELRANFDMKMKQLAENIDYMSFRETSFALYLYAGESDKSFLMLYYNGTDDMLYIDFTNLSVLQETIPLFKIFKPVQPNLKIKLGLESLLENKPVLNLGVNAENATNTDFLMNYLTGEGISFGDPAGAALDPVDLVGKLLEGIYVQNDTLSVVAANQILSVLLAALGVQLGEGTELPGTNIFGKLNIMNPDPESGFLELHLGLIGEEGAGTEFLKLDLRLLNKADITGNPKDYEVVDSNFKPETYQNLYDVMTTLVVAFELGGKLQLEPMREGGFSLGELLAKLVGAKYVDPYINTVQISSDLDFSLKANVDISGLNIPEGGSLVFDPTTLLNSEIMLTITDRKDGSEILGIYYKGGDLYLDLHYFLGADGYIRLRNAGDFIYNLISGASLNTEQRTYYSAAGGVKFETNATEELNSIRLGILATISPYGLTIALAEGALTNLLGGLLGIDADTMIDFGAVEVGFDLSDGIDLSFSTSIEDALMISLSLGDLSLSANPDDKVKVFVPQGVEWISSDMSTLLTSVLVKAELSLGVGGRGQIDLSPLVSSLLSQSGDPNASKIDIDILIDNLGLDGAELNAVVEANLNFQEILKSKFRLNLYKGAVENGDVILAAIYDGEKNKLYVKTQLFGISDNDYEFKELDIDKLMGSFMSNALKSAEAGNDGAIASLRNSPFFGMFSENGDPDPMREFIQIIFVKGGIQLKVAEEALIFLFNSLGIDPSAFFDEFSLEAEGELSINPLSLNLTARLNGDAFTFKMGLGNLSVAFGGEIELADLNEAILAGNVTVIESFTSIGVDLSGTLGAEVSSGDETGEIYFNELIKNILGSVQLPAEIDGQMLSTIGLLIKVIGQNKGEYPKFGGTLYYNIGGVLNIAKIENLFLTFKLGTYEGANDVLDVVVRGSAEAGSTGIDIYVNAEKLLGIKPFVIKNVANFVNIFASAGVNAKGQNANGQAMPEINRAGDVKNLFAGLTLQKEGTDAALANAIVLYLAANYEEFGLAAPIVLDVGAGALYGLLKSLAGIDLGSYLEGHDVSAKLTAGGSEALLTLDLGLQGLISLGIDLKTPKIDLVPKIPDAPLTGYSVLDDTFTTLRVTLKGQASLKGEFDEDADPNDPLNKNTVNLGNLIGNFLTGVNLDILLNLLDDVDKTMKYSVDASVNLKKLIAGDWSGLNGKVEFFDTADQLLIGAYYLDGTLYLDLSALNMGKIRIDNFAVFLEKILGSSPSAASAEAMRNLPADNAARDAALQQAALNAYINILLGNDTGIVLEVTADAIAIVLSALSFGDTTIDGNAIKEVFHDIIELRLGLFHYDPESDGVHILELEAKIASYSAAIAFDSAHIDFEDTDVRPDGFTDWQAQFGAVGELSEWIYIKTAFTFGWHLSDGMEVDFTDILGTFLSSQLDMLSISPILKILNEFGQNFKLEIEGKIHFGNLMRDGTLLPDLLGKGGFNADVLMDSELSIKLISTTGDENREVISLEYVDRTIYADLSAFSIGKVRIPDAYNYFLTMFAPGNNPAALAYALPYSTDANANQNNDADYIAKQIGMIGAFINLNVSSSAVALHVGTAGLFAILDLVGLDLSGAGLTLNGLYDLINPLGDIDIAVWIAKKDKLLELALSLTEWAKDENGNHTPGTPSDPQKEIALTLGLDSDFKIGIGDKNIPDNVVVIADADSYDRLTDDAVISVATRLDLRIDLKEGTIENIYKDPLESLIGSLLTQIVLSVGIQILEDQSGVVTLSIEAEVPLLTVIAGITAGGSFDLSAINARITLLYSNTGNREDEKSYATIVLNNGDLFADLSLLGGPKAMIKDLMGLIAPASAPYAAATDGAPASAEGEEGNEQLLPKLPVSLELLESGFFITVKREAFNTIFGLINVNGKNLGDWEITDDLEVKLGITGTDNPIYGADGKSFKLGASLAFIEGQDENAKKLLALGIDLNGIGAKFSRFGITRPDAQEYANIMDVDTVLAKTSLEFNLAVNDGQQVDLKKTVEALFNALGVVNPLGIPLAPQIKAEAALQDTLRLDLEVAVNIGGFAGGNINDILAGIKVKATLYSMARPDFFKITIAFDNSVAYIDGTAIGLGKIKLPVNSLIERILGGSSPAAVAAAESIEGYGRAMAAAPVGKEAEARKMLAVTGLMFGRNGITAIVAYDTIATIVQMLGVPLGDYLDGVIAPSVEIEITDRFGFNIVGHILTGDGSGGADDEIARLGLSLVGQTTSVDVKVSNVSEIKSFVPEDADAYVSYDELTLYLNINASISVGFLEGYIPLDDVLDLLISNMKMGIDIGETHDISFALSGKIGIDLKAFLARSTTSFFGELSLNYTIRTSDSEYDQTIAKIFIAEDGVYVELKLQDIGLDLKVQVPDLNIPSILWNLIDGKDPFAAGENALYQVSDENTRDVPYFAPLSALLAAKANGTEKEYALPIVIALNSQELNVEISTLLLASVLPLLGLQIEEPEALVSSILSGGKLAIQTDPTFRIYFRLQKDSGGDPVLDKNGEVKERGGYVFELSLFQNTVISTDREKYLEFASRFTSAYEGEGYGMQTEEEFGGMIFADFADTFLPFNLKKLITGGQFDVVEDFISTLGGKVEIGLGVDFQQLVFDLSALFQNEDNAYFYIQIAEALKSAVNIVVEFDASLKGIIKDATLGVDARLSFEDENGYNLLTVLVRGGGSGVSSAYEDDVYPAIYLYSEAIGIPKLKINSPVLKEFAHLDLNALLESLGLKVGGSAAPENASYRAAPQNGILDNSDEGLVLGGINIGNLLDSVSINPGKLSIVLAKTIVQDILAALLNFPFDEIEDISATIADGLYLNVELQKGFAFKMNLSTLEVDLGGRAVFGATKQEVQNTFNGYLPLSEYKWAFELESELTITDDLVSVFSLSKMTTPLIGADVTIEAGEVLGTKLSFYLKGFIDFADLSSISLQLAIASGGKQYVNIMYVGNANNPEDSWVYLDLTGLGLTSLKLNLDVGSIVKNLLGALTAGSGDAPEAAELIKAVSDGAANAMRPQSSGETEERAGLLKSGEIQWGLADGGTLEDVPFGAQLLLLAIGSKDVSVAITGALLSSLIHGLSSSFTFPEINYLRIGYVEGKMTGIELVLNEENFRIAYSFTDGSTSEMGTDVKNPIDPTKSITGERLNYTINDIGVIQQVFVGLNMEIRIDTRNANGNKSTQIEALEKMIESLLEVAEGTIDLAPQNTSMILSFNLQLALNLAELNKTQLALTIGFGDTDLLGVYFDKGAVYADLSGLGLFEAKISGLDLISLILNLLGDTLDLEGGLKVGDLINGVLPASPFNAERTASSGAGSYANAARVGSSGVAKLPKIRVVLTNDSIYILPSMSAIGAIVEKATGAPLGMELPEFAEIRLGINLKDGLNNLNLKLKLDNYNNGVDISIPADGGITLKLNDSAQSVAMPTNFSSYGGISGISLSNGGISLNTAALVSSLIDSIDAPNTLGIYIKKRNSYFTNANAAGYGGGMVVPGKDVVSSPLTDNNYYDSGNYATRQTSASVTARRDQATNYLELSVAANGNKVAVRYNACNIVLYIQELNLNILGSNLLSKLVASIMRTFVGNGITITQLVIGNLIETPAEIDSVGMISGTVTDETGKPIAGATVTATRDQLKKTVETDSLGNYAFTGLWAGSWSFSFQKGGYNDVLRESVEIKNIQTEERAETLNAQMFATGSTIGIRQNVIIEGTITRKGGNGGAIAGAKVYIDNNYIGETNGAGGYYAFYEVLSGAIHTVLIQAPNYKDVEFTVEVSNDGQLVRRNAEMEPLDKSKGVIRGKFVVESEIYKDGKLSKISAPVSSDVEIWLKRDGKTIIGDNLTPIDYLGWKDGTRLGTIGSDGAFAITNLDYGTYTLKIRSTQYENLDIETEVTLTENSPSYIFTTGTIKTKEGLEEGRIADGKIILEEREKTHFSENHVSNAMIGGIRIRLGADVTDGDGNNADAGNTIGNVFEKGDADSGDNVTYIEAWLSNNLGTMLFDYANDLLNSMLGGLIGNGGMIDLGGAQAYLGTGYESLSETARITPITLLKQYGTYNEDDLTIYDYRFAGRAEYLEFQTALMAKYPAAFVRNLIVGVLPGLMSSVPGFLVDMAMGLLRGTFGSVVELLGTIFPFTVPYNLAENKDLPGNPLAGYAEKGLLTEGAIAATDGTPALTRKVNYAEKSVYARIKLNLNNQGGMLESIKLFVNGASYKNVNMGAVSKSDFSLKYEYLDKTEIQTVSAGVTIADNRAMIDEWLRTNTVNDYIVVEDYAVDPNTDKEYLYNQYYIRNNEADPTADEYFELDIINTGLYLKSAKSLAGGYTNLNWDGSYGEAVELPTRVIFNNPYDLSDFTVEGGSWANATGGVRSNTDKTKTVTEIKEILPTRNKVSFNAGGSEGSSGAAVNWNLSAVDFDPAGGEYNIIGSCLNLEVKIPCVVKPRTIDKNNILSILKGDSDQDPIPAIDPYNFNELDYTASLPKTFREGTQYIERADYTREEQIGKYVFDELKWDLSDVVVSNKGTDADTAYYIHLTYGFAGSGKGTVDVPVKVLNRTAIGISAAVAGSYEGAGIKDGVVIFDPFEVTAKEARDALTALKGRIVTLITASGNVETKIDTVDLGSFRTANFDRLDYVDGAASYEIYFTVKNSEKETTRIAVTVKIRDKRIESSSLTELTASERTIRPYRKGGMYDKNIGLNNLPSAVRVKYADGTIKTLTEGQDYIWGLDLGNRVVLEGTDKSGKSNWYGLMSASGGTYRMRMFAPDGTNAFAEEIYGFDLIVEPTTITSAESVIFEPYNAIALPNEIKVGTGGAAPSDDNLVNVKWLDLKDEDISPNFAGSIQYSDVEVYDALFAPVKVYGVKVAVKQANVESVVFPAEGGESYRVNPYLAYGQIEKLLNNPNAYLTVAGADGVRVTKELYEVVGFEITEASLSKVRVRIKVGNKGYSDGKKQWTQEFVMSLNTLDMTKAVVSPITVGSVFDGLPGEVTVTLDGEAFRVPVTYLYDEISSGADFYKTYENTVPFVPKNLTSVKQNATVYVTSNKDAPNEITGYTLNGAATDAVYAFDDLSLPTTATLTFRNGEIRENVAVIWDEVENYRNDDTEARFTGRIGAKEYGFIAAEYALQLKKDAIGITDLPEIIKLDPLKDAAEQLSAYAKVNANTIGGTAYADTEFPIGDIDLSWQGSGEKAYPVKVGRKLVLNGKEVFIYDTAEVLIEVSRREAAKLDNEFVGNVYSEIDFNAVKEVTVVFASGEIMQSKVSYENWSGLEKIDYAKANVYTVSLTVFADRPNLTQTMDVRVTVKSAILIAAYRNYEDGVLAGKVNTLLTEEGYMLVDPFAGFDKTLMPDALWGQFDGFAEPILLSAEWSYAHIVNTMSVAGGDYTVKDHNAGRVTLYLKKGETRVRPQELQFEVRVEESVVTGVQFSKDALAQENSTYEDLKYDEERNGNKPTGDRAVYYQYFLNPYALNSYNENPTADDFTYYKSMKVTFANGKVRYFGFEHTEFQIYDQKTLMPTVTSDLYKGRDVVVRMIANKDRIRDNNQQILASDAIVTAEISVRIYDMTYTAGGYIPENFTVDLYKKYFDYADISNVLDIEELRKSIKDVKQKVTIFGTDILDGSEDAHVSYDFDGVTASTGRLNVNYNGETGFIDYVYGNEIGGMQTVSVPVNFVKRVVSDVFDKKNAEHYYTMKDGELYTMGKKDDSIRIDGAYTKNFTEGFIYDPFANYTAKTFLMNASKDATFAGENGVEKVAKSLPIEWNTDKLYIDLNGGDFIASAEIKVKDGENVIVQTVKYRYRVLKRKVVSATSADDPNSDNLKSLLKDPAKKIRAYDYIAAYNTGLDVDAEVGKDLFVSGNPSFTVRFAEGADITYNFGVNAGDVEIANAKLEPEGAINMSFHIDSLKPLNSKGNDVRFEMTIPGYGLGAVGQQSLYLYVKSEAQEIVSVKTWLDDTHTGGNAQEFIDFFRFNKNISESKPEIESIGLNNEVKINNPYFFIGLGGLQLPSSLWVTVKSESQGETGYVVEGVNWTGARSNYLTVSYAGGSLRPAFSMPVDNQSYSFEVQVMPMLFTGADGVLVDTTNAPYAADEVILLPKNNNLIGSANTVVVDRNGNRISDQTYIADDGYGYEVTFSNGEKVAFHGVNGGGNYRNNYNLWDFTAVDFGDVKNVQYASMTLGGKGGQTVKWTLRIASNKLIGTSMQTVQLAQAAKDASSNINFDFTGNGMGELGGDTNGRLPNRYYQYYSGNKTSEAIPVTYGALLDDGLNAVNTSDNVTNFTYNAETRTVGIVSKNTATPATQVNANGEKAQTKAAALEWTATAYRAYPAPSVKISGYLYFGLYPNMSGVSNKGVDAYFRNPDNGDYNYNLLAPNAAGNGWKYPNGLIDGTVDGEQDDFYIPKFEDGAMVAQNNVPIYELKKGTPFDVKNLPLFSLGGSLYYVPWNLASVYYDGDKTNWSYDQSNQIDIELSATTDNKNIFSYANGQYNVTVTGGIRGIDTSVTGRYTLVLKLPNANAANGNFQLIVAIDVVD